MTLPDTPRPWWAPLRALLAALTLAGAVSMGATACDLGGGDDDDAEQGQEDGDNGGDGGGYGGGGDD
ncbi:hypothetical protein [Nocardiopsis sp. CC223A]|uniref:hypothetical protein n=1 Tax=Nocardiopsis sp. CC223A TaxID=3044051 RepID=UPI00278C790C|nr:hypothetical protein [Nocardiopsis sp. CC223A]